MNNFYFEQVGFAEVEESHGIFAQNPVSLSGGTQHKWTPVYILRQPKVKEQVSNNSELTIGPPANVLSGGLVY